MTGRLRNDLNTNARKKSLMQLVHIKRNPARTLIQYAADAKDIKPWVDQGNPREKVESR